MRISAIRFFHRNRSVFLFRRGPQSSPHHVLNQHISSTFGLKSNSVGNLTVYVGLAIQCLTSKCLRGTELGSDMRPGSLWKGERAAFGNAHLLPFTTI